MNEPAPTRTLSEDSGSTPATIVLAVIEGPHAGQVFTFGEHDTFVVGRSAAAHCSLPESDPFFSRLHFLIEVNPPLCKLLDLKSKNGTLVNGTRVTSSDLKDGDIIRAGTTTLRVEVRGGAPAAAEICGAAAQLAQVVEEIVQRRRAGAQPSVSDYARRYPELARVLPLALQMEEALTAEAPASRLPDIPGYRIEAMLGEGGMGTVYRATRTSDGRVVAVKTIKSHLKLDREIGARFLREARILSQLRHEHIVSFLDMSQTEDFVYLVMELIEGCTARDLVQEQGPLPVARAARLLLQVLDGLAYAHDQGIVHRDLKPANILIVAGPDRDVARIADFGLAKVYHNSPLSGLTFSGDVRGTPLFMPPEQVLRFRTVQPAGDQYAAMATLYYLLSGAHVHEPAATAEQYYQRILEAEPVRLESRRADLPRELVESIHRGLAREPERRFADVRGLRAALAPFA